MANIKSQIKRNKQNDAAHERNKSVKSALKTSIRRFQEAAEAGEPEQARELANKASRKLDKAASAGVIHKNQAANKKSAMAKRAALSPARAVRRVHLSRRSTWIGSARRRMSGRSIPARRRVPLRPTSAAGRFVGEVLHQAQLLV